ncbi:MAG: undecaprenyldiphospho-muramoylpentapeptide beta-N-acetylglucosaminyltransferase [Deltaproteobacteria bacterium]|nr:undecaprenyldiphospho-muramoylpentapeptide beta-N-acetylglucosaminyltransferase [Deltaproteobacteria bacterium]
MKLIVAGGGTGGHLYPGLAVADEVKRRGGEVLFVGTERGIEARAVPAAGYPLELLKVSGLKRMGLVGSARALMRLPLAFWQSVRILRRFKPDCVLGVGGYASGPLVLAAALSRIPTALQEQNSAAGFTNKTLGRFAKRVFLGFREAEGAFGAGKCLVTGNPVRQAFVEHAAQTQPQAERGRLLVVGGSQGAKAVNELMLGAMQHLAHQQQAVALVHQAGKTDAERLTEAYGAAGLGDRVQVKAFIDDMVAAYAGADLVIGRAGALTLAELAIVGRPAILIPLPTAADDHQTKNARAFADAGAALVLPQGETSPVQLAETISALLNDRPRLDRMATAMKALGRTNAAQDVVDGLVEL